MTVSRRSTRIVITNGRHTVRQGLRPDGLGTVGITLAASPVMAIYRAVFVQ
jgi:hypothetical protein